jgi:hypothetical protein
MTRSELTVYEREGAAGLARLADRQLAARKQHDKRVKVKAAPRVKAEATAEAGKAAFYDYARALAFDRAGERDREPARCEVVEGSWRCPMNGVDPDHVVGGSHRKDSERLGAEGLMVLCRTHHDLKHANSPTRAFWLDQAKAHALRHGFRDLLALVEKAMARHEAKHGRAA